jgi:hypothetical protein
VGISQRMKELLNEGSDAEDGESVKERLEALEKSSRRIESMLARLCGELDERTGRRTESSSDDEGTGLTGTLIDLDRSGTADIDH